MYDLNELELASVVGGSYYPNTLTYTLKYSQVNYSDQSVYVSKGGKILLSPINNGNVIIQKNTQINGY